MLPRPLVGARLHHVLGLERPHEGVPSEPPAVPRHGVGEPSPVAGEGGRHDVVREVSITEELVHVPADRADVLTGQVGDKPRQLAHVQIGELGGVVRVLPRLHQPSN